MDPAHVRLTQTTLRILETFMAGQPLSGAQIGRATGIASGSCYPILSRLERAGWLSGTWEDIDPRQAGRPRSRFYHLTELRERQLQAAAQKRRLLARILPAEG